MVKSHRTRFIPQVQKLEDRLTPAQLIGLTAAELASLHDTAGTDGEADIGQAVQLPAANAVILLRAGQTGMPHDMLAVVRGGLLADSHSFGDRAPAQYASAFAQAEGLPLYEPTLIPEQDGMLPIDPSLLQDLSDMAPGDVLTDAQLTDALDMLPVTLTAPGAPLQLAVATEGGWTIHTLALTGEFGEPAWTLESSVFTDTLSPGLWELTAG